MEVNNLTEHGASVDLARPSPPRRTRQRASRFVLPLFLLVLIGFDLPVLLILAYSLSSPHGITLANYQALASNTIFLKVIVNTIRIATITTIFVAILGYLLAYWISNLTPLRRNLALALVILPYWVSVLVRTYAWIVILGNAGLINRSLRWLGVTDAPVAFLYNDLGVVIGMVNILLPLLVLPLYASMIRVDKRHMQAAASLGASQRIIFWKVFFPQTVPALSTGVLLTLILCLGYYITPALLGGGRVPMIANMLDIYINQIPQWQIASSVSIVLLVVTLSLFGIYRHLDSRKDMMS